MASSCQSSSVNELFDLKNNFYTGSFQQTINEAQKIVPSDAEAKMERDIYMYRAYIAQSKYRVVMEEINSNSAPELQSIKLLAEYMAYPNRRDSLILSVKNQLSGSADLSNLTFVIVAATLFSHASDYEAALRVLHKIDHLESCAMTVEILLHLDRVDIARKELKAMQDKDEDATLTQLAQAWVNMSMGGEKFQDAFYIFQELIDKYGSSVQLLNGQAVCVIAQGRYDDAESIMQQAMEKDSNNVDSLINMIFLSRQLGKSVEVCNRFLAQLKDSYSDHQFVVDYQGKESEFLRLSRQFSVK